MDTNLSKNELDDTRLPQVVVIKYRKFWGSVWFRLEPN